MWYWGDFKDFWGGSWRGSKRLFIFYFSKALLARSVDGLSFFSIDFFWTRTLDLSGGFRPKYLQIRPLCPKNGFPTLFFSRIFQKARFEPTIGFFIFIFSTRFLVNQMRGGWKGPGDFFKRGFGFNPRDLKRNLWNDPSTYLLLARNGLCSG